MTRDGSREVRGEREKMKVNFELYDSGNGLKRLEVAWGNRGACGGSSDDRLEGVSLNCKIPSHGNIDGIVESGTGDHCFDREPRTKKKERDYCCFMLTLLGCLKA